MSTIATFTRHAAAAPPRFRWDAEAYVKALHPRGSRGRVTLMAREGGGLRSRTYSVEDALSPVVLGVHTEAHGYVTMNRYHGPRGGGRRLAALTALWVDLDVHRTRPEEARDREAVAETLLREIARRGLPPPSFLIDSGRGFYGVWLIEPLSPKAEGRWRAAMRALVALLHDLGADPACVDPARVLRLPGAVNEKCGREVNIVAGDGARRVFDELADHIFRAAGAPTRRDLREARRRRKAHAAEAPRRAEGAARARRWPGVLRDLDRLLESYGGRLPQGLRDLSLHLRAAALSHVAEPAAILPEVQRVADAAAPELRERDVARWMAPAIRRAERAAARRLGPGGADPRYNYAGSTMAALLGVDVEIAERLGLEQIIPGELRAKRKAARRRAARRARGVLPRAIWLSLHPLSREEPWRAEGISRASWYRRLRARRGARVRAARQALLGSAAAAAVARETGAVPLYEGVALLRDRARKPSPDFQRHIRPTPPADAAEPVGTDRASNAGRMLTQDPHEPVFAFDGVILGALHGNEEDTDPGVVDAMMDVRSMPIASGGAKGASAPPDDSVHQAGRGGGLLPDWLEKLFESPA